MDPPQIPAGAARGAVSGRKGSGLGISPAAARWVSHRRNHQGTEALRQEPGVAGRFRATGRANLTRRRRGAEQNAESTKREKNRLFLGASRRKSARART